MSAFRALRHRNFRLFFIGQTASLVGTWMQNIAQVWLVYRLTHSEVLLGTTGFLSHIPTLVLGPLGGVMADRFDRRRLVIITQTLFLLQAAALAALTLTGLVAVWHVMVLALFAGIVDAFDRPGRQSMLIHLAGREDLLGAISLNSLMYNVARIVGPSIGGLMVAAFGEGVCFSANAASFFAVLLSLFLVAIPPQAVAASAGAWTHLKEGFDYIRRTPATLRLLIVVGSLNLAAAPVWTLQPFFADSIFGRGSQGTGFLTASMGAGAVIGMIDLARRKSTKGMHGVVLFNTITLAVGMFGFAVSPVYSFSAVMMALLGYSIMRMNSAANTAIQSKVPEELRGRVMGFFATANIGGLPIGALAGGAAAAVAGPRWVVAICSVMCGATAAWFAWQERQKA